MEPSTGDLIKKKRNMKNKKKQQKIQIEGVCAIKGAPQSTETIKEEQNISSEEVLMPIKESIADKIVEGEILWKDLIPDLVFDILEKLSHVDRLSATYAIPTWRQVVRKPLGPCLISFANDDKTCTIVDALYNFEETVPCPNLPSPINILFSKHGWLLLMERDDDLDMPLSIFFYNPMSNAIIKLPLFSYPSFFHFSFSTPPDSPDCVVIASFFWEEHKKIVICEKGHDEWTLIEGDEGMELDNFEEFKTNYMSPVFHKGRFYWIGKDGRVGEFDLHTRSWRVHGKDMRLWPSTFRFYLVESDDDLFSVWSTLEGDTIRIYKLDLNDSKDIWKETYNIGGKCLFVGLRASLSLTTRVLSCNEDKIYFQMLVDDDGSKQFVFYSGERRKLHPHGNFLGCSERLFNSCWIEPQWVKPKFQQLPWC